MKVLRARLYEKSAWTMKRRSRKTGKSRWLGRQEREDKDI